MGAKTSVAESCIDFRRVRGAGHHVKDMMTTLNSRLLVSQSRSGGRFQVGFGVLCWGETHQQLSGATHTRLFGWFHFTGVLLLQGALRFASEQQNPENNF